MRKARWVMVALAVAATCTTASALNWGDSPYASSYTNTTGGTVYVLNAPTSWANIGADPVVLAGAGPDGETLGTNPATPAAATTAPSPCGTSPVHPCRTSALNSSRPIHGADVRLGLWRPGA
jgi:hypothetical protein